MVVPFDKAQPGEEAWVYKCPPLHDYGWVTDPEWFDDMDEPTTVKRQLWRLVSEDEVTFHHSTELCPECHGDGAIPSPAGVDVECAKCKGDGGHPLAGEMEVHTIATPTKEEQG